MEIDYTTQDNDRDSGVDEIIRQCLNIGNPKSFFLFAGAGSGKTRSLVSALEYLNKTIGNTLLTQRRNIAIITYTNAACDEIKRRIEFNPLFLISTIHSFAWELIKPYTKDIRLCLQNYINESIEELEQKQAKGRPGSQAYLDRPKKIENYRKRLTYLSSIKRFIYNPDGNNTEKNSLDHSQVIKISAQLITAKRTLQDILIDRYPILLIDESQDTKKELMDAFLMVQSNYKESFSLGLLGDTMQRIYLDGKEQLQNNIPDDWEQPCKIMNHRSRKRIVDLCNSIRESADGIKQEARRDKPGGVVRIFIAKNNSPDITEQYICEQMAAATDDSLWKDTSNIKCLTIEHQMAAKRLGFHNFFEPLYNIQSYKQGLLDGTLSVISIFVRVILPIYNAYITNNKFEVTRIVRENSKTFKDRIHNKSLSFDDINTVRTSVNRVLALWDNGDPQCIDILRCIIENELFDVPSDLEIIAQRSSSDSSSSVEEDADMRKLDAISLALAAPFSEVIKYQSYVSGEASFDTHQGVKGRQFPRVMVIIDDEESQGTTFNYNKLFGIVSKSSTDIRNEQQGRETTIDRTRRLLYVTCSRAMDSLVIVFYTNSIEKTHSCILESRWFTEQEIIPLP